MDPPLPLASDPSSDLVDYFKLLTEFLPNNGTQHTTYKTDRAQGVRKLKTVKRWTRKEKLGEGTFGTVWREVERDGSERAVKAVSKSLCLRKGVDYKRELAAMAKLSRHEEIFANFHGWFEDSESVYLAMEYFKHGDLQTCMDEKIPEDQVKAITAQLLEGLKIMHENNFTHRDMKPQNVFVVQREPYFWVKIGDLGITKRIVNDQTYLKTEIGTREYMAPEVLGLINHETEEYTDAVDIWSLGCICHRLLTLVSPFAMHNAILPYCGGNLDLPIESSHKAGISNEAIHFVKSLMAAQPSQRPSAEVALKSIWLNETNLPTNLISSAGPMTQISSQSQYRGSQNGTSQLPVFHFETFEDEVGRSFKNGSQLFLGRQLAVEERPVSRETTCSRVEEHSVVASSTASTIRMTQNQDADKTSSHLEHPLPLDSIKEAHKRLPAYQTDPIFQDFQNAGFNINSRQDLDSNRQARQAFEWAADHGTWEHMHLFLEQKPRIDASERLRWSAKQGLSYVVQLLLEGEEKIWVDDQDHAGPTALYWACVKDRRDAAQVLLHHRADFLKEIFPGFTVLHCIPYHYIDGNYPIVKMLKAHGANFKAEDRYGRSAYAVSKTLNQLRVAGFDPNSDDFLYTAMSRHAFNWAAKQGSKDLMKWTLAIGAKFDKADAMRNAASLGFVEAVQVLLDELDEKPEMDKIGAFRRGSDEPVYGNALQLASRYGQTDAVRLLLKNGADPNATYQQSRDTALHHAVQSQMNSDIMARIVELLLENGADPLAKNSSKMTALKIAKQRGSGGLVALLGPVTAKASEASPRGFGFKSILSGSSTHSHNSNPYAGYTLN